MLVVEVAVWMLKRKRVGVVEVVDEVAMVVWCTLRLLAEV